MDWNTYGIAGLILFGLIYLVLICLIIFLLVSLLLIFVHHSSSDDGENSNSFPMRQVLTLVTLIAVLAFILIKMNTI